MNQKIISAIIIFSLIIVVPTAYGQLTLGSEAKQELIEVKISPTGEINVKHIVSPSNMPTSVTLFEGEIKKLIVTNDLGEEINSGTANDVKGNLSVMVLPSKQSTTIEYNLENMNLENNISHDFYHKRVIHLSGQKTALYRPLLDKRQLPGARTPAPGLGTSVSSRKTWVSRETPCRR